jgi:hypothetical protein
LKDLLVLDPNLKKYLSQIATLFGVPHEIVKSVWEYTLVTYFVKISENVETEGQDNKTLDMITIPYVGNLAIRTKIDVEDENKDEIECFISLSDTFKNNVLDIKRGNISSLCDYIENKQLKDLLKILENET